MHIPWFRRSFLIRRRLDRVFLDPFDAVWRAFTGRRHWPPYSLRAFVGGAKGFDQVGKWFLEELRGLGLFSRGAHILDIGCGCGRVSYTLATDSALRALGVSYWGMDIDRANIEWCQRNITRQDSRFTFYHADCYNPSYNPRGSVDAKSYRFPHPDSSFELILLSSVLTHVMPEELRHYLSEVSRLLAPGGVAYASFFLYDSEVQVTGGLTRHGISFPYLRDDYALNREDYPANAVAYQEAFVRAMVRDAGLRVIEPTRYGIQDLLLLATDCTQSHR
jgi:SAM-dependent methyltransferase